MGDERARRGVCSGAARRSTCARACVSMYVCVCKGGVRLFVPKMLIIIFAALGKRLQLSIFGIGREETRNQRDNNNGSDPSVSDHEALKSIRVVLMRN